MNSSYKIVSLCICMQFFSAFAMEKELNERFVNMVEGFEQYVLTQEPSFPTRVLASVNTTYSVVKLSLAAGLAISVCMWWYRLDKPIDLEQEKEKRYAEANNEMQVRKERFDERVSQSQESMHQVKEQLGAIQDIFDRLVVDMQRRQQDIFILIQERKKKEADLQEKINQGIGTHFTWIADTLKDHRSLGSRMLNELQSDTTTNIALAFSALARDITQLDAISQEIKTLQSSSPQLSLNVAADEREFAG